MFRDYYTIILSKKLQYQLIIKKLIREGVITINNKEYLLSTNKFQQPKVLVDRDCCAMLLLRLLLLEPGSMPDQPEMGVGIVSHYLHSDIDKIDDLRLDIQTQISKFLPSLIGVSVEIATHEKELRIQITVDGVMYSFDTDSSNNSITISNL